MSSFALLRSPLSRGAALLTVVTLIAYGLSRGPGTELSEGSPAAAAISASPGAMVVDSTFMMDEEIRRFRIGLDEVTGLTGGASSKEELADVLLRAVERADTAAVASLTLTQAEFAWLYFPHTIFVAPPYELSPALVWFQTQNSSASGLNEILGKHSGRTLYDTGLRCPDEGKPHGLGRVWDGCMVLGRLPAGEAVEESLFGSILEWNGRYKLVSFTHRD